MSCQVNFPLQDIVLLLRDKISPEIIGAVPEEKLEEEVLLFIQPKIDELQEQLTKLPPEVHVVTQVLEGSVLETTLNNGKVLTSDLSPLFTKFDGLLSLYDKNVAAGAGAKGWTDLLIINENGVTQQAINNEQVNASRFKTLSDAIAAAQRSNKSLVISTGKYTLTSDLSIPVDTQVLKGATFDLNGKTLTFEKDLQAGRYKIFNGEGVVKGNNIQTAYTDWFGAVGDGYVYDENNIDIANKTYTINNKTYGFGVSNNLSYTDNTDAINRTIAINARKTIIANSGNGIHMIDTAKSVVFKNKKDQVLIVEAKLKAIRSGNTNGQVLHIQNIDNCDISFTNTALVCGEMLEHDFTTYTEWQHGIHIANAVNSRFYNLKGDFASGDGCYVSYPLHEAYKSNKDLYFLYGKFNYNRRTGYVIEVGENIHSHSVEYLNTGKILAAVGTLSGVDVEPFGGDDVVFNTVSNINFISCKAYNNARGGIRMERVHTGKIVDCELIGNGYAIELHGCGKFMMHDASNLKIVTIKHDGLILCANNFIKDNRFALLNTYNLSKYVFTDNTIINCSECSFVVRAVNSSIKNNTIINSRYCDLMHMIDTDFEHNKFIGFIPPRDWQTPLLNIARSASLEHYSYDYQGFVLADIEILDGGTGLTYDNIKIVVSGSEVDGGNARVYPVITNGVLTALQISEYGYRYKNEDSCVITITGGTKNPVVRTICKAITSTSKIENNTFKLASALETTKGSLNTTNFAYTDVIVNLKDNYFDPRLSIYDDVGGSGSKNIITMANKSVVQRLAKGTLVQDVDGLKVTTSKGVFGKFGTKWYAGMPVNDTMVVYTSSGKMYHSRTNGIASSTEPSGYDEWWNDGSVYWTFMGEAPTMVNVPSAAQPVQLASGTDDTATKLNSLISSLRIAGILLN